MALSTNNATDPSPVNHATTMQGATPEMTILETHIRDAELAKAHVEKQKQTAKDNGLPFVEDPHGPLHPHDPALRTPVYDDSVVAAYPDRAVLTVVDPENPRGLVENPKPTPINAATATSSPKASK